jgi:ERCC4-type nuclease
VGPDKALKIAKKVKTVEELARVGVDELMEVEGVGRVIAEGIVNQRGREG